MSTITIVEQRLPVSILLLSRISTYAHVFESVIAIILFWLCPSLTPKMPERETYYRLRRYEDSASIYSVASTVTTLFEDDMSDKDESEADVVEDEFKLRKFSILSAPMAKSKSLSLVPFARRMSLPAKRFSEHFTTTLSNPFQSPNSSPLHVPRFSPFNSPSNSPVQTPSSEFEPTGYFSPLGQSDRVHFEDHDEEEREQTVEVKQLEQVEYFEKELMREPVVIITKEEVVKVKKIVRVAKKAKSFLRIRRQS